MLLRFIAALACVAALCSAPVHADPAYTSCPAFPAFPGTNCTGPTLTPSTVTQFRTNGQVIENVEIQASTALYVPASNVTFRDVRIIYTGPLNGTYTAVTNEGQNNTFESVEIDGRSNVDRAITGTGTGLTVRNCNIHHVGNGLEIPGPFLVEDNYIHDIYSPPGTSWHADGIQNTGGATANDNITIRHNTIILTGNETGAISVNGTATNPATNVLVENNLLAGGSYTMYSRYGENYRVLNNHFSTRIFPKVGQWGIWYPGQEGITRSGNVIDETGASADS